MKQTATTRKKGVEVRGRKDGMDGGWARKELRERKGRIAQAGNEGRER